MEPTRLVSEDDRFDALLLRSGLEDEPDPGALRRAEAALGLCAGVALGGAGVASKWGALKLSSAHSLAKLGAGAAAKWVGAGLVSGALVASGVRYAAESARERPSTPSVSEGRSLRAPPTAAARREVAPTPAAPSPLRPPEIAKVPAPKAAPPPAEAAPSRRSPPTSPAPASRREATTQPESGARRLANEVAILERARRALFAGSPDATLRELDAYERSPDNAILHSEAELLRIEALVRKGNLGAAQALAKRSLQRAPNGPYSPRLREIISPP